MGLSVKVTYPASLVGKGKVAEIEKQKPSILLEMGESLHELIADWMVQLNASRSKHGSNHYTPDGVLDPVVSDNSVAVPITIPGITRALHDIIIKPVEAQSLAIPLHADAYGITPRHYNDRHPKGSPEALFRPKGKDYLAKNDSGNLVVMYLLRKEVHQSQDRTLLPSDEEMRNTALEAAKEAVEAILNN